MQLKKRTIDVVKYTVEQMPNGDWQAKSLTAIRRMNIYSTPSVVDATRQGAIDKLLVKIRGMVNVGSFEYVKSERPGSPE